MPADEVSDDNVVMPNEDWNARARGETDLQRLDRNFSELLQELRVTQTGIQILFAFLLTLAFTQRFEKLSTFQHNLYIVTLLLTTAATGLFIAPVAYHRLTFRQRMRPQLVASANWLALGGLTFLLLALASSVLLITDVVLGVTLAAVITALATLWLVSLWYGLPLVARWRHDRGERPRAEQTDHDHEGGET